MGRYTDNLYRRRRTSTVRVTGSKIAERLTEAAIIRTGVTHAGHKSHAHVRAELGDDPCYVSNPNDVEGFLTSTGRFVDREQAKIVGEASGQTRPQARELLSSDIDW